MENAPPDTAWGEISAKNCGINTQDMELITQFGRELGKSDLQTQLAHCESYHSIMSRRAASALTDRENKSKLYTTLGIVAGLGLAILFL